MRPICRVPNCKRIALPKRLTCSDECMKYLRNVSKTRVDNVDGVIAGSPPPEHVALHWQLPASPGRLYRRADNLLAYQIDQPEESGEPA